MSTAVAAASRLDRDSEETVELEILRQSRGRAVLAEPGGDLHLGRIYRIYHSGDLGRSWQPVARLPMSPWRRLASASRLTCRLLRQEVRALVRLDDGAYVAANREGVFYSEPADPALRPSEVESGESPVRPPMRLTVGPGGVVLWGEYTSARPARAIRLFASRDSGRSFDCIHTLEAGSVLHVHNIVWDPHLEHYWVLAGDHDREPGIGMLSSDLLRFEWFVKGEQRYRAVVVFDFGDRLIYATDTEREPNGLIVLDKATGKTERVREFDGSCIYGCRFGGLYAITTTVEPGVNRSPWASLWLSRDALHWKRAWRARKDRWNPDLFQFGSLVLPAGSSRDETIFFSGQAVAGLDDRTVVARLAPGAEL